jgi:crossover junction endodeoxyribonuclease RuvC
MAHNEWSKGAFFGIDPGLKGAVVALDKKGELVGWTRMPLVGKKDIDFTSIYQSLLLSKSPRVSIERVHAMPKQGVTSMFTFGKGYGGLLAVIDIAKAEVCHVLPRAWQKKMLPECPRGQSKEEAVRHAVRKWEELEKPLKKKVNQGIADAALLAEYGRHYWGR